jgi:hypothetical protein
MAQEKRVVTAYRITGEPPKIDGLIDEEVWQLVDWEGNFIQQQPYEGREPSQQSSFKILYDDDYIYAAIMSWDSYPDSIVSRLSRRDIGDGDAVGIEFDSYFDKKTAFSFIVTASGVKIDKLISNDGEYEDENWDAIWVVKTSVNDRGWIAEIKIPFNQLRFNKNDEQKWGLQVGRFIHRKEELSLWQPVPRDAPGWVHQYGILEGIKGIKPRRQIEIAPYVVAKTERFKPEDENPFATGKRNKFSGGIDAKIGITNDVTLDLTVFPDFGQVEADPSEVNLTAFETYFPEKRPFFIEGSNLFNYGLSFGDGSQSSENLFYSRRIGRTPQRSLNLIDNEYCIIPESTEILGASKITGKNKSGVSFAIMEVITNREYAQIDINGNRRLEEVEPYTNYFVGSLHKDFNESNTQISGILTSTNRFFDNESLDFLHTEAYSGGLNLFHQWNNKNYYLNFKSYFSHVAGSNEAIIRTQRASARYFQRPDATHVSVDSSANSLTGHGGSFIIGKGGDGNWRFASFITWKSPKLEVNDIGYIRSVDDIFQVIWFGYRYWKPFSIFREVNLNFNQWTGHNFTGELSYFGGEFNFQTQFKNYWSFATGISSYGKSVNYTALRGGPSLYMPGGINGWGWFSSDDRKKITFSLSSSFHSSVSLLSKNYSLGLAYKPINALAISLSPSYSYSEEKLQYVENIEHNNEMRYINASLNQDLYIFELWVNFSITPDLSFQYYGRPFFAKGKYYDFKRITNPKANSFTDRFHVFNEDEIGYNAIDQMYLIDENLDGTVDYRFEDPNFNFRSFQSNLVVRWEYRPGSTLFLVWSQGRDSFESDYNTGLNYSAKELWDAYPHNVFLVKFAYRFY